METNQLPILGHNDVDRRQRVPVIGQETHTYVLALPSEPIGRWCISRAATKRLTSPGSAKYEVSKIAAQAEAESLYLVYLVFDSQNKLGAVLRNPALVVVMAGEKAGDPEETIHMEVGSESPTLREVKEMTADVWGTWTMADWLRG